MGTLGFIALIVIAGLFIFVIQSITAPLMRKANRGLLNKKQYQEQESVTRRKTSFAAKATLEEIQQQLSRYVAAKEKVGVVNDLCIASRSKNRITYIYGGKFATIFTAEIHLAEGPDAAEAEFFFRSWQEQDGVADSDVLDEMKGLLESVTMAMRAADPDVIIHTSSLA